MADCEKASAAAKTTADGREKKRATTADKQVVVLEVEPVERKAAQTQLVDISAQYEADASKVQAGLESSKMRLDEVEQNQKLASINMEEARKQSVELSEAAEEALCQLMKVLSQTQILEGEVSS